MEDSMEHIIHGILEYSLKPYANINNMDVKDLIQRLYDHYQLGLINNTIIENDLKLTSNSTYVDNNASSIELTTTENHTPVKRGRGRPKGSKNKPKHNNIH